MRVKPATKEAYDLLHNGTRTMARIEANGMRLDIKYLKKMIRVTDNKIQEMENDLQQGKTWQTWVRRFGRKTNLNSPKQLATVFFKELGYESKKKTLISEEDAADEAAFAHIKSKFLTKYFRRKKYQKLGGTYLKGILREQDHGYLHPFFNLHTAVTYRGSSDHINFQNIPIRDPIIAEIIRSCFIPRKGHVLVEMDFSGIEVRVAACYNHDPTLIKYIKDPTKDMHRDMAAQIFFLRPQDVSKMTRYCAKNMFVFPQFYGDYYINSARALWEAMERYDFRSNDGTPLKDILKKHGITSLGALDPKLSPIEGTFEKHIKDIETHFWRKRFPVYSQWKKDIYEQYQKTGGIHTLTGFTFEGIAERNKIINNGIQGSAFHCELWSAIQLNKWLLRKRMSSMIIGHIHDSIIADVHESELQTYLTKAKEILTEDLPDHWKWIIVPLEVEVEVGTQNWFKKEPWIQTDKGKWIPKPKEAT